MKPIKQKAIAPTLAARTGVSTDFDELEDEQLYVHPVSGEQGGPKGPEPTRYGDWERQGRTTDF